MTEKFLMARNFFRIFTENNPVMGYSKTFFISEAKGLISVLGSLFICEYSVRLCVFGYFRNRYPKLEIFGYPIPILQFCKNT